MYEIPEDIEYEVDGTRWGKELDPSNTAHHTTEIVSGYITIKRLSYERKNRRGHNLWLTFQEDFEGWTEGLFSLAARPALRELRELMVARDVWVKIPKGGLSYAKVFMTCLGEIEPTEMTEARRTEAGPVPSTAATPQADDTTATDSNMQPLQDAASPPPPNATTARMLIDVMKVYNSDERKYGGEEYDILDTKLLIFFNCCKNIGLTKDQYYLAFPTMLKGDALEHYHTEMLGKITDIDKIVDKMRAQFETRENRQKYLSDWQRTTLQRTINENPGKTKLECFQLMVGKLKKIRQALPKDYRNENIIRDKVISACRGVAECSYATFKPADTFAGVCADLQSSLGTAMEIDENNKMTFTTQYPDDGGGEDDHFWTDRTYRGRDRGRGSHRLFRGNSRGNSRSNTPRGGNGTGFKQKQCYVCGKIKCWSTKHSVDERRQAFNRFREHNMAEVDDEAEQYNIFLARCEGVEVVDEAEEVAEDFTNLEISEQYMTELGTVDALRTISVLSDHSTYHAFTRLDPFQTTIIVPSVDPGADIEVFTFERYSSYEFRGIMPDSGAAGVSSAGEPQVIALRKQDPSLTVDTTAAGDSTIKFGKGTAKVKGIIRVPTPIGTIAFHVVSTNTPFLLCLQDMDALGVRFDNIRNVLIQGEKVVPIIRRWGHPWMLLNGNDETIAWNHLTESELRQIHRRFGHPSVQRLANVLNRAGHDVNTSLLKEISRICHQCQMNGKAPGRFRFTLKDDHEFNFSVLVDVMYLDGSPVLQVVDSATAFGAARFLKDMSAVTAWNTLRACWIDTYLGPPDMVVHDAGTNFAASEFRQLARAMAVDVKEVPVEAHNSIGKVERYHAPLRRAYEIIRNEMAGESVDRDMILQMAVKAVNDTAGPNGLVPTLLVFGAYPRLTEMDPPSPSVTTDSYSLYECLVKLGTTKEKRLMIDIMALRQSYERREIAEVRWIGGRSNPADAMTKGVPNRALESFINTNELKINVEGWVDRG